MVATLLLATGVVVGTAFLWVEATDNRRQRTVVSAATATVLVGLVGTWLFWPRPHSDAWPFSEIWWPGTQCVGGERARCG